MTTIIPIGREDRAMLRSNLSARTHAEAWAAMSLSLLFFVPHALALNALNLSPRTSTFLPVTETPWLPFGKIYGAETSTAS